jgi:mono/diheme cytochrome c family protein
MRRMLTAGLAIAAASVALASAHAQSASPAPVRSGADLFAAKCSQCHEKGGWGTRALARRVEPEFAELRKREGLPAEYVKHVVRHGIGSMPQFTATDLTNEELARLASWLEAGSRARQ